jgi:hypothetical protein
VDSKWAARQAEEAFQSRAPGCAAACGPTGRSRANHPRPKIQNDMPSHHSFSAAWPALEGGALRLPQPTCTQSRAEHSYTTSQTTPTQHAQPIQPTSQTTTSPQAHPAPPLQDRFASHPIPTFFFFFSALPASTVTSASALYAFGCTAAEPPCRAPSYFSAAAATIEHFILFFVERRRGLALLELAWAGASKRGEGSQKHFKPRAQQVGAPATKKNDWMAGGSKRAAREEAGYRTCAWQPPRLGRVGGQLLALQLPQARLDLRSGGGISRWTSN